MTLDDALEQAKGNGECVRRASWPDNKMMSKTDRFYVVTKIVGGEPKRTQYVGLRKVDDHADEWEVVK